MIFLFLLPVISILPGVAQSSSDLKISPQNNEIISPTPSSAQQMRYQSPQPALATGAVNLSIPLYTIDIEGLKIPFTLNYHTSGIKPLDDPFPCGYGWSLLPGLKVTRTIRGREPSAVKTIRTDMTPKRTYLQSRCHQVYINE